MKARIVWLILCGIWGSTWLFIKLGLADLPPLTFAGIRFLLAGLILTAIVLARRVPWPRGRDWILIAIVGFLQFTLNYGLTDKLELGVNAPYITFHNSRIVERRNLFYRRDTRRIEITKHSVGPEKALC